MDTLWNVGKGLEVWKMFFWRILNVEYLKDVSETSCVNKGKITNIYFFLHVMNVLEISETSCVFKGKNTRRLSDVSYYDINVWKCLRTILWYYVILCFRNIPTTNRKFTGYKKQRYEEKMYSIRQAGH